MEEAFTQSSDLEDQEEEEGHEEEKEAEDEESEEEESDYSSESARTLQICVCCQPQCSLVLSERV